MRYKVLLTAVAESDLEDLHGYIAEHDSPNRADYVLDRLMEVAESLATFPERGSHPKELLALGIREYRHLRDCRWQAGYAVTAVASSARRVAERTYSWIEAKVNVA
jgi:plasmid stabilization system protein ParE